MARITGTVLYPTESVKALLGQLHRFSSEDLQEVLSRPSLFYEALEDDEAQLLPIRKVISDLAGYPGEMVSIQGLALGTTVKTEEVPQLRNLPLHMTTKAIGVVDSTGAMPIVGISSEDARGEVSGNYKFYLSVYRFEDGYAVGFLINKEAVPLDSVTEVAKANLGDSVRISLRDYMVSSQQSWKLSQGLSWNRWPC